MRPATIQENPRCARCSCTDPAKFKRRYDYPNRWQSWCRDCSSARAKQSREKHGRKPYDREKDGKHARQRDYGLSDEAYNKLIEKQGGKCAGCGTDNPGMFRGRRVAWPVDHDHETGEVRGILCNHCNTALGLVKDNPKTLRRLADYVER